MRTKVMGHEGGLIRGSCSNPSCYQSYYYSIHLQVQKGSSLFNIHTDSEVFK